MVETVYKDDIYRFTLRKLKRKWLPWEVGFYKHGKLVRKFEFENKEEAIKRIKSRVRLLEHGMLSATAYWIRSGKTL